MIREWQSGGLTTEELARRRRPGVRVSPKRTVVGSLWMSVRGELAP